MLIFRQDVATTRLKNVFDIDLFIQEIPMANSPKVSMKWDTDTDIYIYIYIYVILWENRDLQFIKRSVSQFVQNHAALFYMFISLLHIINSKRNFIS